MKGLKYLKFALAGGASVLSLIQPAAAKIFDIPSGDLATALDAYRQQAGVEVIYSGTAVKGHHTQGAKGDYTEVAALTRVLAGTGFTALASSSSAVGIVPQQPTPPLVQVAQTTKVSAAPPPPQQSGLETVVVTAQKKSEDIQTVPIAVTALTQQQLTDRQIAAGPDLLKEVPNMDFTKTNFSGYNIELRGIGTQAISVTTDPAVAVAFNDIPFIRNHFFEQEFFDVDNIEVLRGPQGTLYGRNATAGVVNLISAKPTDQYEAMLSADIGNYENRRLEGMVNIPIVGDELDLRIAGEWTKRDGYTEDTTLGTPVDGRDLWSGRMTLGWKPTSNLQTYFVWEHFSEDDDRLRSGKQLCATAQPPTEVDGVPVPAANGAGTGFNGSAPPNVVTINQGYLSQGCQPTSLYSSSAFQVPYGPSIPYVSALSVANLENFGVNPYAETTQSTNLRDIQSTLLPTYKAKNDTLEFNAAYNINSSLTLTSETGFNQDFLWSTEDYNRFDTSPGVIQYTGPGTTPGPTDFYPDPKVPGSLIFCDPQLGCSDRLVAEDLDEEHAWQLSQEFRLTSNFGGPFNFSLGGNFLHYETEENYYVFVNSLSILSVVSDGSGYGPSTSWATPCTLPKDRFHGGYQAPNPIAGGDTPTNGSCIYVDPNPIGDLNNDGHNYFLSQNPYTLNSYALFGETYYNITNDLKLTTGLRWTVDQKHFIDIPSEVVDTGYGFWVDGIENQTWERPTGRAVLDWTPQLDFTDQTLLYASYAHGYKAGGANPPGAVFANYGGRLDGVNQFPDHPLTFKPEYIESFELGTKNTLLDGSLTLNGDIFYYNYTGYQISEIVDRTAINNNYNAHVEGAELESTWEPLPGLKFNFAGGWEDTAAAGGDEGIDLMDRTAGMPGWMVMKPFVTAASNCMFPDYVVAALLEEQVTSIHGFGYLGGNGPWSCGVAYQLGLDPVTGRPYMANPTGLSSGPDGYPAAIPAGYPGFNPLTPAYNDGEGFDKNLSGNKLPNAPPFTVSLGGEYSMPVSEDWVATARADFYWQADSWARIFNDNPYDSIHGYDTLNLTLILNSANGWTVMGYVKNVFNVTAITGDFLNSDDSGLTTNVFLTDPRLYGIRVTKRLDDGEGFWGASWNGADLVTDMFADKDGGRPPLWIELGGQIEHLSGQGQTYTPGFLSTYSTSSILQQNTTPTEAQQPPLFSAGEEAKISWQPDDSDWVFAAAIRYGRSGNKMDVQHQTHHVHYQKYSSGHPTADSNFFTQENFSDTHVYHQEAHSVLDFMAGKDMGLGLFGEDMPTVLSAGIRIAQYISHFSVDMRARPDLHFKYFPSAAAPTKFPEPYFHTYHASQSATRKFHGIGPSISWSGSAPITDVQDAGITFDWGANAAILFGRQRTTVHHHETARYWPKGGLGLYTNSYMVYNKSGGHSTDRRVTVPNLGGFAGFSYRWKNAKISLGYRTDLFLGAIDGGIDSRKSETLGMSGPFATISFGLGG